MSEFRNAMPSSSEGLTGIPNFRNLPQCYEVFDIDGDGESEVMGCSLFPCLQERKARTRPCLCTQQSQRLL